MITYRSIHFSILSLPSFEYYKILFYTIENEKIVPLNIDQLLTPRGLAYWIMDNGYLKNKGLHLNTYNYSYENIILLKNTLENLFQPYFLVKCSIHNHKKGYRIYIWEESMILLIKHIYPFMYKDMLYKLYPKK